MAWDTLGAASGDDDQRASALGWAPSRIVVIDDDLGVSAAVADARAGFARLVTEVTMGRVGIVLGIEMSRLARTGRDWHQLLELCSLSGCCWPTPMAFMIRGSTTTGCCWG